MGDSFPDLPDDTMFTNHISNSMELRNRLRSGLVEAQGKDTQKIPLFVSWPEWLEDVIVCLYARDFYKVLQNTVHEMALSLAGIIEGSDETIEGGNKEEQIQVPGDAPFTETNLSPDSDMNQNNS